MENSNPTHIIFEDDDLLVLAKPAGVVVNEAVSAVGETVQAWARSYLASQPSQPESSWKALVPEDFDDQYGSPEETFLQRAGMVHRLDKETSGVLLWAKNPGAQVELLRQFRERLVQKTYECFVHGKVAASEGEINVPIDRSTYNRQRFAVSVDGRPATTKYQAVARYQLDFDRFVTAARQAHLFAGRPAAHLKEQLTDYLDYTYLRCQPKTGRTHQIRVHCQHLGHPLVGDNLYQGRKRIKLDEIWCDRHFLHAAS
ncbi:RluA family pseudouridine synthase, partial [Candidatus Woesebacteria bacterium]|nr:RluA family pseudouridine synthase [Candidatus Woesebacteria bacterium]